MKKKLKVIAKKVLISAAIIVGLSAIVTSIYYKDIESYLTQKVYEYLDDMEYGTVVVKSVELSVFSHFPNIGVQINDVQYYETKDSTQLKDSSPILAMQEIDLVFNSWKLLISDQLAITTISASDGEFSVLTYSDGSTNLDRAFSNDIVSDRTGQNLKNHKSNSFNTTVNSAAFINFYEEKDSTTGISYDIKNIYIPNVLLTYSKPSENLC